MADKIAMRKSLAHFLGDKRYREFIRQINSFGRRAGRLRFWQEEAWAEFTSLHPEFALSFDQLCEGLRVCWVHGCELESVTRRIHASIAHKSYDREYAQAWATMFPYSPPHLPENHWPFPTEVAVVECCPECDRVRAAWEQTTVCSQCNAKMTRVICGARIYLSDGDKVHIETKEAILGGERGRGQPSWVCLQCVPDWAEVHQLAWQDYEWLNFPTKNGHGVKD